MLSKQLKYFGFAVSNGAICYLILGLYFCSLFFRLITVKCFSYNCIFGRRPSVGPTVIYCRKRLSKWSWLRDLLYICSAACCSVQEFCHAVVAYFDIDFSYTHCTLWVQNVLITVLSYVISVCSLNVHGMLCLLCSTLLSVDNQFYNTHCTPCNSFIFWYGYWYEAWKQF